ncbi:IS66 family transposase [Variovorax ginsengisoli]|uniref:Transposase n=1 Tax=Variovorax ginsengisoli TaxID=363844 RepID=A0ABT8SGQ3_9BURK|nr:transposase [Variovorax ginsengisoli]MDN8618938.1 transposase [Variovorax ginsengisoli]MDO1538108.1 transposase [Variovorax ginsengisoli]
MHTLVLRFNGSAPRLPHEEMRYFAEVYRIEGEIREADPDERLRVRQSLTLALMAQFLRWLSVHAPTVLPKSPLGEATASASRRTHGRPDA